MSSVFLELQNIKKNFGGIQALKGVDLTVRRGEIHCLAGENGCGKSTLIKVISGVHDATEGEIRIDGRVITNLSPIQSIQQGIQVIYQDFAIFPNLTVAENIAMNGSLMRGAKLMKWAEARQLALSAMEQIGAHMDPDALVETISVANKQMVAICRAIINDAKLLILDEPTTALTANEVAKLNIIIRRLKQKNIAVLIVNHKLNEIFEVADYLTILRNGQNVAEGRIGEFNHQKFIKAMTGREFADKHYRPAESTEEILRVENYSRKNVFENVTISLKKGDILGITGLLGSGRGEIGDSLFGILPAESGSVRLNGKEITIRSVEDAINNNIAYVPEDRLTQGLFLERSIQDKTVVSALRKYSNGFRLNRKAMYEETVAWIKKIGCAAPFLLAKIRTLSGGNAQKIVIAKWLNADPKLLILNGPTVGVDVGAKVDIHQILRGLAEKGVGIIIISDDLAEIIHNCNKVIVMRNGRPAGLYHCTDLDENKLSAYLSEN